jgi:hypothetical protein
MDTDTETEFDSDSYLTAVESDTEELTDDEEIDVPVDDGVWHHVIDEQGRSENGAFEFQGTPGLNPSISVPERIEHSIPFFLQIFLSEATFAMLVNWTNARAWASVEAVEGDGDGLGRNLTTWRDCTVSEMKKTRRPVFVHGNESAVRNEELLELRRFLLRAILSTSTSSAT